MATETQRKRLRSDIGANSASLPDGEVDDIFTEAGESYTGTAVIKAYTRVIAIRRLLANAAKLTDYTQNASQEKQSQVFKHLKDLLGYWESETATAVSNATTNGAARFGGLRRKPKRLKEFPDG